MRFYAVIALALTVCGLQGTTAAPTSAPGSKILNQYIVVFKNDANSTILADHQEWLQTTALSGEGAPVFRRHDLSAFPLIPKFTGFSYLKRYQGLKFKGYAAKISADIAKVVESLPEVAFVEQDTIVSIVGGGGPGQANAPWGLRRLVKADLPLATLYTVNPSAGAGVDSYIIDTGIEIAHPEFAGRARIGASFSSDRNDVDGNGHGTHVAGTVGGSNYGVAKSTNLIAVKVLAGSGSGTNSDVIAGVNWVANAARTSGRKSVANMSLGGGVSAALDAAVKTTPSPLVSPLSLLLETTAGMLAPTPLLVPLTLSPVAASDINDAIASFSDRGTCVDIVGPRCWCSLCVDSWNYSLYLWYLDGLPSRCWSRCRCLLFRSCLHPAELASYLAATAAPSKINCLTSTTKNLLVQVPQ
ncbi:peptidase S8/S53 domain-containing protein [Chytridium lagenaria]|nr:peptidase S8/S53 domain-containing protein [Chytridium lagenaria]